MKKLSSSFAAGAIALVFAVLGYETALLVHYSATTRILASQVQSDGGECQEQMPTEKQPPQTPGKIQPPQKSGKLQSPQTPQKSGSNVQSPSAKHPGGDAARERVRKIRSEAPNRQVESFRFDPNTVSEDSLIRLGFSQKQARSIINYRSKGGRFRRKEDFAGSYVVSEETYKRLEGWIDIPKIDINTADSATFDTLPGIGGYFARKMVDYRKRLRGYSHPEQLMDIYHFDEEKFNALKDLITLSPARAYPLWTLPADSLRLHPYIGTLPVARGIVFFREHNPRELWSIEELTKAGVLSQDAGSRLGRCSIAQP